MNKISYQPMQCKDNKKNGAKRLRANIKLEL